MSKSAQDAQTESSFKPWLASPIAMGLAVLLVGFGRISFLSDGYGGDPDAHRLALAACQIWETGHYTFSREPGHPFQEYVSAPFCALGPVAINSLTALMSLVGVLFFGLAARRMGVKVAPLLALGLGFSPLYWVHSVDAMDYVWALSLGWVAVYCSLCGLPRRAGLVLGLAVGCRVTEAITLFACLLVLDVSKKPGSARRERLELICVAAFVATLLYLPVWVNYGRAALRVYDTGSPGIVVVLSRLLLEPWGILGAIGLGFVVLATLTKRLISASHFDLDRHELGRRTLLASASVIVLTVGTFLRLPHDAGYVLPLVPWVLLSLALVTQPAYLLVFLVALGLSSLPAGKLWKGPVFAARHERRVQGLRIAEFIQTLRTLPKASVVVAGTYQPKILSQLMRSPIEGVEIVYLLSEVEARDRVRKGEALFYLRRARSQNQRLRRFDLDTIGATPIGF